MGYLFKGYYVVFLSVVVSVVLYYVIDPLVRGRPYTEFLQAFFIGQLIPTIGIQVFGIALCLIGFLKRESMHMGIAHEIANVILLLWGLWVAFINWFWYGVALDHPQYISQQSELQSRSTSVLIGLLWIVSAIFFIYTVWRSSKVARAVG
jgi:hypothetical protein